jgi:hypothetical protein
MNLRNIIILIIIIVFLGSYFNDAYIRKEKMDGKIKQNFSVKEDSNDLYINPYLLNNEVVPNVIKRYIDNKINIISNFQGGGKNIYDSVITSTNNNTNKNNLIHFINFLI